MITSPRLANSLDPSFSDKTLQGAVPQERTADDCGSDSRKLDRRLQHFSRDFHRESEDMRLIGPKALREAAFLVFCDPIPKESLRLFSASDSEWRSCLQWLNVSGLALYFVDRIEKEGIQDCLPGFVDEQLQQSLTDNRMRTALLLEESTAIQRSFQSAGLSYATLKGFSLGSPSVPDVNLRCQLDMDFLVADSSAPKARGILEARGYRLRKAGGRSLEFSANDRQRLTLKDLYKPWPNQYVELHIETTPSPLLARVELRRLHGGLIPVLDPVDLFLGQGLHIFRHFRSSSTRASHLLEFQRHVVGRAHDVRFWDELETRAKVKAHHPAALGLVLSAIENLMGPFAPPELTRWTVETLTPSLRAWAKTCASETIYASPPTTKMYQILDEALTLSDKPRKLSWRTAFIPTQAPQIVATTQTCEMSPSRLRANLDLIRYNVGRLAFYAVEGTRYLRAYRRYRKTLISLVNSQQLSARKDIEPTAERR